MLSGLYSLCEQVALKIGFILFELFHHGFHTVKKLRKSLIASYAVKPVNEVPQSSIYCNTYELLETKFRSYRGESNYICNQESFRHSFDLFSKIVPKSEAGFIPDVMWQCKLSPEYMICTTSWNNMERESDEFYCVKPSLNAYDVGTISCKISDLRYIFLYVEYMHPSMSTPVELNIPKSYYLVSNELFSPSFVFHLVKDIQDSHVEFDDRYTIRILNNECDEITLESNQYMILGETDYEIKTFEVDLLH